MTFLHKYLHKTGYNVLETELRGPKRHLQKVAVKILRKHFILKVQKLA